MQEVRSCRMAELKGEVSEESKLLKTWEENQIT